MNVAFIFYVLQEEVQEVKDMRWCERGTEKPKNEWFVRREKKEESIKKSKIRKKSKCYFIVLLVVAHTSFTDKRQTEYWSPKQTFMNIPVSKLTPRRPQLVDSGFLSTRYQVLVRTGEGLNDDFRFEKILQ